jgi:hypothetical protein
MSKCQLCSLPINIHSRIRIVDGRTVHAHHQNLSRQRDRAGKQDQLG